MKYLKVPYELRCGYLCKFDWDIDCLYGRPDEWPCDNCREDHDMFQPVESVEVIEEAKVI